MNRLLSTLQKKTMTICSCACGIAIILLFVCSPVVMGAQPLGELSALNAKQFARHWTIESESPDYRVSFLGDTVEIVAPKGLTLWRNEKMQGDVSIEYDACIMDEGQEGDRLSDLNCFWMASDPAHPNDIFARRKWRSGIFVRCYTMQLYYMGYGGNSNKTTRFRRYDGNELGVTDAKSRPAILVEYTDSAHLNKAGKWRHIRLTTENGRVCYYIDGERLVDFRDPNPLKEGWFGFRTTWSRVRLTNFRYTVRPKEADEVVDLRWISPLSSDSATVVPASFGVPFAPGSVSSSTMFAIENEENAVLGYPDFRPLAYWPDGSVKWGGFRTPLPVSDGYRLRPVKGKKLKLPNTLQVQETEEQWVIKNETLTAYLPKSSSNHLIDSLLVDGKRVGAAATLHCRISGTDFIGTLHNATVEQIDRQSAVIRCEGWHQGKESLPYIVRLRFTAGTPQIMMSHTLLYDRHPEAEHVEALGVRFQVPMQEALYNRHVAFATEEGGVWSEPVQPLVGRRVLTIDNDYKNSLYARQIAGGRIPERDAFDKRNQGYLDQWASWSDYRLSQLNDMGYTIRKRAKTGNKTPWIGTFSGNRAGGSAFLGDVDGGLAVALHDFWQSYPSTLEITGATSSMAALTVWLWSPEAEPMDMRHYDTEAHGLDASYEDVQEGLNTPYGIGRTSHLVIAPQRTFGGSKAFSALSAHLTAAPQLMCSPEYLHRQRAFGIWSLPDTTSPMGKVIEQRLQFLLDYYRKEIDQRHWYGYWNYGDVMHNYDAVRGEWMYDVGGFAWDNTELASNSFLWYNFLRTGDADAWRMAVAMTRHTAEVDCYHLGPHAGLGSRHNVTHWGCGAKESRISQAIWNRFYYYFTGGDERTGDLMTEVRDADTLLYHLDPMRLAQPRELHPCTAPARLRIGPDWLGYVANWMTEWERTGDIRYRDKILAGMKSISALPNGIFTGPQALGYDPATGIISYEGDPNLQNTNHLLPIMGGFELMPELITMMEVAADCQKKNKKSVAAQPIAPIISDWKDTWLSFCAQYRHKAWTISKHTFLIPRLAAYAFYYTQDSEQRSTAWKDLRPMVTPRIITTNSAATWTLDAIYMQEVCPVWSEEDLK